MKIKRCIYLFDQVDNPGYDLDYRVFANIDLGRPIQQSFSQRLGASMELLKLLATNAKIRGRSHLYHCQPLPSECRSFRIPSSCVVSLVHKAGGDHMVKNSQKTTSSSDRRKRECSAKTTRIMNIFNGCIRPLIAATSILLDLGPRLFDRPENSLHRVDRSCLVQSRFKHAQSNKHSRFSDFDREVAVDFAVKR